MARFDGEPTIGVRDGKVVVRLERGGGYIEMVFDPQPARRVAALLIAMADAIASRSLENGR